MDKELSQILSMFPSGRMSLLGGGSAPILYNKETGFGVNPFDLARGARTAYVMGEGNVSPSVWDFSSGSPKIKKQKLSYSALLSPDIASKQQIKVVKDGAERKKVTEENKARIARGEREILWTEAPKKYTKKGDNWYDEKGNKFTGSLGFFSGGYKKIRGGNRVPVLTEDGKPVLDRRGNPVYESGYGQKGGGYSEEYKAKEAKKLEEKIKRDPKYKRGEAPKKSSMSPEEYRTWMRLRDGNPPISMPSEVLNPPMPSTPAIVPFPSNWQMPPPSPFNFIPY